MAFGFFRSVGRALTSAYHKAGYTVKATYEAIKRRGYGYRERTMRQDIGQIYSRLEREEPVRKWPGDMTPRREIITETQLRQPERTYRIFGEIDYYDWEQGKWLKKNISFYDDYLRTKEEWGNKFIQDFGDIYATRYNQTIYGVNIFSIEHNKGHLY